VPGGFAAWWVDGGAVAGFRLDAAQDGCGMTRDDLFFLIACAIIVLAFAGGAWFLDVMFSQLLGPQPW
jgi:hypothetical protein